MEYCDETKSFIRKINGAITYVGGCPDGIITDEVGRFLDICFRNNIKLATYIIEPEDKRFILR